MKLCFAPMEGITTYTYRNTHAEVFGMCDEYFAPFITPADNERLNNKNLRDILSENNRVNLKVQVLCTNPASFSEFAKKIRLQGYDEVNLNFGCPSGTVVKKGRGSGALRDLYRLDKFLADIFSSDGIKISVKTRTGFYSHDEFDDLLGIYNKYPLSRLIIHPRVREDYYKNKPCMPAFDKAYHSSSFPLCYNGDITSREDFDNIVCRYPRLDSVMIGRGAIKNPAVFREIKGGAPLKTKELILFSDLLRERYLSLLGSEVYTLHKLKEIWLHAMQNFPDETKILKAVKKSNRLCELDSAVSCLPEIKPI